MGSYDAMQVCENGHVITDTYYASPEFRAAFCEECGAGTRKDCPTCSHDIEGDYTTDGMFMAIAHTPTAPKACKNCGSRFPWADQIEQRERHPPAESGRESISLNLIADRLHAIVRQLRHRHGDRPTLDVKDEYDVQDLLHAILLLRYDDVRAEEWNPSYSGGSTRSDFLLKVEQTVIEVKMTRRGLNAKKLGDELIIDIAKYQKHPDCKSLFCLVYDPDGYIKNPRGLESDLNRLEASGYGVRVRIVP